MNNDSKQHYRVYLRRKRASLSQFRRDSASEMARICLKEHTQTASWVMSYASFGSELDMWTFNQELAKAGKLVLPTISEKDLKLFQVTDINELKLNSWGILEPNPEICQEIKPHQISLAFIPGLGFDCLTRHRLGYGRGYYDKLLSQFLPQTPCWGIGFREQEIQDLPFSEDDVPLAQHYLF